MWKNYRKTLIPTQACIITLCLILHFYFKANIPTILVALIAMEFAAVLGAMWSSRLQRKINAARNQPRLGH